MRVLLACDSFKNCKNSSSVNELIKSGILSKFPNFIVNAVPVSDGGEGFSEIFKHRVECQEIEVETFDAFMNPIKSSYLLLENNTAIVELAKSSGIELIEEKDLNVKKASTYGTGVVIKKALENGAKKIVIALGGSATNDAGTGIAEALGFQFFDKDKKEITNLSGDKLEFIDDIRYLNVNENIAKTEWVLACDVSNYLCGKNGAAYVFAQQKGATKEDIKLLDNGLKSFAKLIHKKFGKSIDEIECGGAAGGAAAGLAFFLNAKIESGIETVLTELKFNDFISSVDLVITGEGCVDEHSFSGKVVGGVYKRAKKYGSEVALIAGQIKLKDKQLSKLGITKYIELSKGISIDDAIKNVDALLISAGKQILSRI